MSTGDAGRRPPASAAQPSLLLSSEALQKLASRRRSQAQAQPLVWNSVTAQPPLGLGPPQAGGAAAAGADVAQGAVASSCPRSRLSPLAAHHQLCGGGGGGPTRQLLAACSEVGRCAAADGSAAALYGLRAEATAAAGFAAPAGCPDHVPPASPSEWEELGLDVPPRRRPGRGLLGPCPAAIGSQAGHAGASGAGAGAGIGSPAAGRYGGTLASSAPGNRLQQDGPATAAECRPRLAAGRSVGPDRQGCRPLSEAEDGEGARRRRSEATPARGPAQEAVVVIDVDDCDVDDGFGGGGLPQPANGPAGPAVPGPRKRRQALLLGSDDDADDDERDGLGPGLGPGPGLSAAAAPPPPPAMKRLRPGPAGAATGWAAPRQLLPPGDQGQGRDEHYGRAAGGGSVPGPAWTRIAQHATLHGADWGEDDVIEDSDPSLEQHERQHQARAGSHCGAGSTGRQATARSVGAGLRSLVATPHATLAPGGGSAAGGSSAARGTHPTLALAPVLGVQRAAPFPSGTAPKTAAPASRARGSNGAEGPAPASGGEARASHLRALLGASAPLAAPLGAAGAATLHRQQQQQLQGGSGGSLAWASGVAGPGPAAPAHEVQEAPWWQLLPDFVPAAALAQGTDPRCPCCGIGVRPGGAGAGGGSRV